MTSFEQLARDEQPQLEERLRAELGGISDVANRTGEQAAVTRAGEASTRASANDVAQFERATRTFDLSPRQQKAAARRQSLNRSVNRASAQGATRRGFVDRAKVAASTGQGFADAFFNQRISGETALAESFASEESARIGRDANKSAAKIATAGKIVGTALAFFSSEKLKDDHGHEAQLLNKLKKVRVNKWNYKGDDKTHVGPFSEEFNREFGIKTDRPDMISVIDALGVTMGAIKELDKKVEARG